MSHGSPRQPDDVDRIRADWAALHPEFETEVIELTGRILRSAAVVTRAGDDFLARYDLTRGEFDVLSALRRAGGPRSPGELRTVSLASGPAITKRLKALEQRGLVVRSPNPVDGRGAFIRLTDEGCELIDGVFPELLARERELFGALPDTERASAVEALRAVVRALGQTTE
ncbi:MarR family winged helix-turn-helix transcriptional regulator [Herbiconiux sp. A18JL235]|uniref:MarR family winged helix-turn-helix transcriptional regulator n=1 Tax=Herbiconiux sp. A18JL235 TaxID=3152363 RepID=A0AB39BHS5_9MICO